MAGSRVGRAGQADGFRRVVESSSGCCQSFTVPSLSVPVASAQFHAHQKNRNNLMKNILTKSILCSLALAGSASVTHAQYGIDLLNAFTFTDGAKQGGIEIVGYTPDNFTVAGIYVSDTDGSLASVQPTFGVQVLTLGNTGSLTERFQIDLNIGNTGLSGGLLGVSSVALDPLGRAFGVASVIPTDSTGTLGKLAFFNYNTGAVIGTINAGFHPDSVRFSDDGTKIYVANEGEFKSGAAQAAGSLSIVDVSSITSGNLATLPALVASTFDFSPANLGSGASLSGIRNSNVAAVGTTGAFITAVPNFTVVGNQDAGAIEPEYVTISQGKAFVTLQDNNAIGVFDLGTSKWEKINNLGTVTMTIDGSDNDSLKVTTGTVKGMPMPDTIASYVVAGKTYLVTANEGDARVDDRDSSSFGDVSGGDSMVPILDATAYPGGATVEGVRLSTALGRLKVSRIDGDNGANGGVAGDGKIDDVTTFGSRSFSIWEVQGDNTLVRTHDSGPLDALLNTLDTGAYNINSGNTSLTDNRSDDKGVEPEGLTIFSVDGKTLLALMLERQNGVLLYDITDPNSPLYLDYINTYASGVVGADLNDRLVSPEGSLYISAADSPTGTSLLLVGYEGHGGGANSTVIEGGIGVFQVVPEPGSLALLLGGAALLGLRRRRN